LVIRELSTATVTGKVANPNGITGLSISEIKQTLNWCLG
jgi:hypothetical protein